jgi:3-deoxy-D-manno-octulosonic-acid transferase
MGSMMLLYSLLLALGLVVSAPWWLARMLTTERYREGMRERLGHVPERLREAVRGFGSAGGKHARVVWVHAVSVGEVLAASRLVGELEAALSSGGEPWRVVVSTTTRTGQKLARERFGGSQVFYFPLDFRWAVRAWLKALNPAALVLMESEVWPRVLWECRRAGVPVVVVNARVSDRSFARGTKVRAIWGRVLAMTTLWLAQSEEDARRLVAMGARAESVRAIGNLKYDVRAPKESRVAELIREAAAGRPIVVAGSTVGTTSLNDPNEEEMVLHAWQDLPQRDSAVLLVLAPRHPERFGFVESIVDTFYARASALESLREADGFRIVYDVIVVDTIGDLAAVYGIADVAFVGGSLVKRAGHNPLEPAQFGVPVVIGPSFENFRDVVAKMQAADAIRIIGGDKTAGLSTPASLHEASGRDDSARVSGELEAVLLELLTDREAARAMGERGRRVFEEQQGATGRAVAAIVEMVRSEASQ